MLIAIIVIVSLSLLILGHEAGHFLIAKLFGMKVDEFGFGFPPRIFAKKVGETEYSLNWLPFGGFVRIAGEGDAESYKNNLEMKDTLFFLRPAWQRALVIFAGIFVNFLIGWILLSTILTIGLRQVLVVNDVEPNSPVAVVGLKPNDVILNYATSDSFVNYVNAHRGVPISLEIDRNGKVITITVTPRIITNPKQGALGVYFNPEGGEKLGIFQAFKEGFIRSLQIIGLSFVALYDLFKNLIFHGTLAEGVVGPLGIVAVARNTTAALGILYLISTLSIVSLGLVVVNVLPFPALDGGQLFLILIEKIKGSRMPQHIVAAVNVIGLALLLTLVFFVSIRDVFTYYL